MQEKINAILDAVDDVINNASWYPETDFATAEMLISTYYIEHLRQAYEAYEQQETPNNALAPDFAEGAAT